MAKAISDFDQARMFLVGRFRMATATLERIITNPKWNNVQSREFTEAIDALNSSIGNIANLNDCQMSVTY